jgi:plasmid stabilization system protein ParE
LKQRRVLFTQTAQGHVRREKLWWLENRDYPEIFADELEQAVRLLAVLPGAGTLYPQADIPGLRRVYLGKVACHVYYTFDDQRVIVRAVWGARRGRGPFGKEVRP